MAVLLQHLASMQYCNTRRNPLHNAQKLNHTLGSIKHLPVPTIFQAFFFLNIVALDKMHHLHPFAATCQKIYLPKSHKISQNYLVIFTDNKNTTDFESGLQFPQKTNLTPVLKRRLQYFTRRVIRAYFQDLFAKTKDFRILIAQNLRENPCVQHGICSNAQRFINSVSTKFSTQ